MKYHRRLYNGVELSKDEILTFWSIKGYSALQVDNKCLSQWAPSRFTEEGITYTSAEQYMMYNKALLFKDKDTAKRILSCNNPAICKKLGRSIKSFDYKLWEENKYNIVLKGNILKFSQNRDLGEFLQLTGDKILIEASPYDSIWGIGMSANNVYIATPDKWKGENLLGFALMEARDNLKM